MSKSARAMTTSFAHSLAVKIVDVMRLYCERVEVAGSLRRARPWVNDLEIVCIPIPTEGLFGQETDRSKFDDFLEDETASGERMRRGMCWGRKHKQVILAKTDAKVDLYVVTPLTWPVLFAIRTGPAAFSKKLVTPQARGGLLPDGHCVKDGMVWRGDDEIQFADEEAFIRFCCGKNVSPSRRH